MKIKEILKNFLSKKKSKKKSRSHPSFGMITTQAIRDLFT